MKYVETKELQTPRLSSRQGYGNWPMLDMMPTAPYLALAPSFVDALAAMPWQPEPKARRDSDEPPPLEFRCFPSKWMWRELENCCASH